MANLMCNKNIILGSWNFSLCLCNHLDSEWRLLVWPAAQFKNEDEDEGNDNATQKTTISLISLVFFQDLFPGLLSTQLQWWVVYLMRKFHWIGSRPIQSSSSNVRGSVDLCVCSFVINRWIRPNGKSSSLLS